MRGHRIDYAMKVPRDGRRGPAGATGGVGADRSRPGRHKVPAFAGEPTCVFPSRALTRDNPRVGGGAT